MPVARAGCRVTGDRYAEAMNAHAGIATNDYFMLPDDWAEVLANRGVDLALV